MKIQSKSVTVVLLGRFMPDKFALDKLVAGKLIAQTVADTASYKSLIPGMQIHLKFEWGELLVGTERFQVSTTEAPSIRISDLALKAIGDLNPEATVSAFGINCDTEFNLGSRDARNALGVRLAPPKAWGAWGQKILEGIERKPSEDRKKNFHGGVVHIQMREQFRDNYVLGWLDVSVMPAPNIAGDAGVLLRANHHHQCASTELVENVPTKPTEVTKLMLDTLSQNFENSLSNIDTIFKGVIES